MKRTAIAVSEELSVGQAANIASILMGQAAKNVEELYDESAPIDKDGNTHAAIKYNIVILKALTRHLQRLLAEARNGDGIYSCAFSKIGQEISNSYEEYRSVIAAKHTSSLELVGVLVCGPDDAVRRMTKRFSVFRD